MGSDKMAGETDQIRNSADVITAGKPTVPKWDYPKVTAETLGAVAKMLAAVQASIQRGTGFAAQVSTGMDSFAQINRACADDYDNNDATGAARISSTVATTADQRSMVTQVKGERGFWAGVKGYWGSNDEKYHLPPAVTPVN
ncbi:hypothetical protein [Kribbella sp. NPDC006257]|uniref:hypothetical protein n=1 Tax=Kribbella sp. NPDC006257 TaxID=3156738 RepID=UPI0033ACFEEB